MNYQIKTYQSKQLWEAIESLAITHYPWGEDYMPTTDAKLYYEQDKGFWLKMRCDETRPKAVYSKPNEPVYKDSCMEFFINFYPEKCNSGYMNFEMNANGALLCAYGHPDQREFLTDLGYDAPVPVVKQEDSYWEVELFIPLTLILSVYKEQTLPRLFKGNFYKCGDDTHTPHYGSWSPITHAYPAFHLPTYFGELILI